MTEDQIYSQFWKAYNEYLEDGAIEVDQSDFEYAFRKGIELHKQLNNK